MLRFAALSTVLLGCTPPPESDADSGAAGQPLGIDYSADVDLPVVQARLHGHLPHVGDFDRNATDRTASLYEGKLYLDLHGTTDDWAMIYGTLNLMELELGVWTPLSEYEHTLVACSGPEPGTWFYDESATSVEVRVDEVVIGGIRTDATPGLEVGVEASFPGGYSVSTVAVVPDPRTD